jgi:hypothetical protein
MPTIRVDAGAAPTQAETQVFTFKEGLLSSMAHDLRLKVTRWNLTWDSEAKVLEGAWDAGSLLVDCVMRDGREAAGVLGAKDLDKIAKTVREEVLAVARHPQIRFRSTRVAADGPDVWVIDGELELHGVRRAVSARATRAADRWVAEVALHQPEFGIKPYSAMLGALKIKPAVRVRVSVAAAAVAA